MTSHTVRKRERENRGPLLPLTALRDRVAEALHLSVAKVNNFAAKINKGKAPTSPRKKRPRGKPILDVDDFTKTAIRNVMKCIKTKHITLKTLQEKLQDRNLFNGCITSLWKIVKSIGFKYCKDDPRGGLKELHNIAMERVTFLHEYVRLKNEGIRQFVFSLMKHGSLKMVLLYVGVKKTKVNGGRYIVLHADCTTRFIPHAELVFSSKTKDMDSHVEMNQDNFRKWFEYQLLVNFEEPSTIVIHFEGNNNNYRDEEIDDDE